MTVLDVEELMVSLAQRRPIFHSEADFQHEFAWEACKTIPDLRARLEQPFPGRISGAVDIIFRQGGAEHAIELKYMTRLHESEWEGERFRLKNQGAQDIRCYDVCKDIGRMEEFCTMPRRSASVVVLTNDPYFWKGKIAAGTCAEAFDISGRRELSGELRWAEHTGGTMKGREAPIVLSTSYRPDWKEYSDVGGTNGRFRYFLVSV